LLPLTPVSHDEFERAVKDSTSGKFVLGIEFPYTSSSPLESCEVAVQTTCTRCHDCKRKCERPDGEDANIARSITRNAYQQQIRLRSRYRADVQNVARRRQNASAGWSMANGRSAELMSVVAMEGSACMRTKSEVATRTRQCYYHTFPSAS